MLSGLVMRASLLAPGAVEALRLRDFRSLWLSNTLAQLARWLEMVVLGWLVLELTNSIWQVTLIGFYRYIPLLPLGIVWGIISDRMDRRLLAFGAQALCLVTTVALTALLFTNSLQYWHLALTSILLGVAFSVDMPVRRTLIIDVVGRERVIPATGLDTTTAMGTRILGPLLAGSLIATFDVVGAYALLILIYLGSAVSALSIRTKAISSQAGGGNVLGDLVAAFGYARRSQIIIAALVGSFFANLLAFPYMQLMSVFARDVLHVGPVEYGILSAASGVGSFVGAILYVARGHLYPAGLAFLLASMTIGLTLCGFALSTVYILSLVMLFLEGIGHAVYTTLQGALILQRTTPEMRGRMMGLLTFAIGTWPVGMLLLGGVAELYGAPFALGLSSFLFFVAIVCVAIALPEVRTTSLEVKVVAAKSAPRSQL